MEGEEVPKNAFSGFENFLAPETLDDGTFNERSVVFSLGLILFSLLTGRFPTMDVSLEDLKKLYKEKILLLKYNDTDYTGSDKPCKELFQLLTGIGMSEGFCRYEPDRRMAHLESFVTLGVRSAVTNSTTAGNDWIKICDGRYCSSIPLSTFVDKSPLVRSMRFKGKSDFKHEFQTTLATVNESHEDYITITHFWNLCCWFSFFYSDEASFETMRKIVSADWFTTDPTEVTRRLACRVEKAFVVRPSLNDSFNSPFTFCFFNGGVIRKARICRFFSIDRNTIVFTCVLIPNQFDTVFDLVTALMKKEPELGYVPAHPAEREYTPRL